MADTGLHWTHFECTQAELNMELCTIQTQNINILFDFANSQGSVPHCPTKNIFADISTFPQVCAAMNS